MNTLNTYSKRPDRRPQKVWPAWLAPALLLLPFLAFSFVAQAVLPPAGTLITNEATATWLNPDSGLQENSISNQVTVQTLPQPAAILTDDQNALKIPGEAISFPHRLENTGNTPLEFLLAVNNQAGDGFDLLNLRIIDDVNGNGIADPGEPEILLTDTVALPIGTVANLVITGFVPNTAPAGSVARLDLSAVTTAGNVILSNVDTVNIEGRADLVLVKELLTTDPAPGEQLSYLLRLTNNGSQSPAGTLISINGTAETTPYILVRDNIPANTFYESANDNGEGRLLFRLLGSNEFDLVSVAPLDVSQIISVVYAIEELPGGASIEVELNLTLSPNASTLIVNQANAVVVDDAGNPLGIESNVVETELPLLPPTITAFNDRLFSDPTTSSRTGIPLYLETIASQCNQSATVVETHRITLTSQNGDTETATATETGANTGVFRVVPAFPTASGTAVVGNGILELGFNDEVTASVTECGEPATAMIEYTPGGTVFDSRTNEPVEGARVVLIDVTGAGNGGNPGGPALVVAADGITILPNEVFTDANGVFQFPQVAASTYRIEVFPPLTEEYIFPSILPPPDQPPGRLIPEASLGELVGPSFGGIIQIDSAGPIVLDIPLDRPATGLGVAVTIDDNEVDIGDLVRGTVTVTNFSDVDLTNGLLRLKVPEGFTLQDGSVLINGERVADPTIDGTDLLIPLGTIETGDTVAPDVITFLLQAGAGARRGSVVACIEADGVAPVESSTEEIRLRLEQFHGYIIGKIYLDCDRDRIQGVEEPGIPGVRFYMEDGTYVVSDAEGKYNFYGISPGLHIVKVDRTTLPEGSKLITLDNRQAGDAHSRFVDLKRNEMHKANFAEGWCSDRVKQEVYRRRAEGEVFAGELQDALERPFTVDSRRPSNVDSRRLPSSSQDADFKPNFVPLGEQPSLPNDVLADEIDVLPGPVAAPDELDGAPITPVLEKSIADETITIAADFDFAKLDNKTGFVGVNDGQIMPHPRITVRAKGNSDGGLALTLNGEPVSDKKIGLRKRDDQRKLLFLEWVSLELVPGANELALSLIDPFGNPRDTQTVTVMAPGKLANIVVNVKDEGVPADGNSVATVEVLLQDKDGLPVTTSIPLTVEADQGRWLLDDAQPREPGTQVIIRGGRAELKLVSPPEPADAKIRVTSGIKAGHAEVAFLPPLRDMLVVGLIEGEFGRRGSENRGLTFERDLEEFADNEERNRLGARSAVFAKGRVGKETLLTLSYDSEKDKDFRLFRDIRPDEFYPVYGDAAKRGFDARSTSKLFLRLDRRQSYLQYGDYNSAQRNEAVSLGRFNRSLTGVVHHYENSRVEVNTFASRGRSTQQIVQIRGRGVSGPYRLGTSDLAENSERIEIVTLDRDVLRDLGMVSDADIEESRDLGTSVELNLRTLNRFTDYIVDYDSGEIVFREPISSLDSNLNPLVIRVTFEQQNGGERFWVAGVNAQVKLTDSLEVGAGYARDENPEGEYQIASANATLRLSERARLTAEYARSESELEQQDNGGDGSGDGYRVELEHRGERLQGRVHFASTEEDFENRSAGFGKGRRETGVRLSFALGDRTRLVSEWLRSRDLRNDNKREGTSLSIERALTDNLQLEFGYRNSKDSGSSNTRNAETVRLRLSGSLPKFRRTSVFLEAEQDLDDSDKQVLALGLEYQMHDRGRLYARHELISSLQGQFSLDSGSRRNSTVVGVDTSYMTDGQVFSEYRLRDSADGADTEAAIGLRNRWEVAEGVRLNASFERTETLRGEDGSDSTALAFGVEYTRNPLWKGTGRLEYRKARSGDSWFSSLGVASKLSRNWTFLGRNTLSLQDRTGGVDIENRLQFGFALRPADTDRWNALMRYELNWREDKPDDETVANPKERRVKHLWSLNYHYQPRRSLFITGHYSGKAVRDRFGTESSISADAHLFSMRLGYYFSERWDFGLLASSYYTDSFREQRYGLGVEAGFLLHNNLWVTAGYNWFGYDDPDMSAADYREEGVYLRLRFKFDERLFDDLGRKPGEELEAY